MLRAVNAIVLAVLLAVVPAQAQRSPDWQLLGEQTVAFHVDRDVITIGQNEEWYRNRAFRALHFVAERNDVHMMSLRIVYLNGYAEDFRVDRLIRAGSELALDLRGERSYLRQIEMIYRSRPRFTGQAVIKVYGEPVRRGGGDNVGAWDVLETQRFDRRAARVEFRPRLADGRLGQIRLRGPEDGVHVRYLNIRFHNGETQTIQLNQTLAAGAQTRAIDLIGEQRRVDLVVAHLRPRNRPGETSLQLLGTPRPGQPDAGPSPAPQLGGWHFLGQQTVGFGIDRDVITIGQNEEWYRNRWYRVLHFVAERNDVHMINLRLVYLNGYAEDLRIDQVIRQGSELPVQLGGERSYLARIEMLYRSRPGYNGEALIKVYGQPVERAVR